ncbi:hypothetical protein SAMN02745229_02554 [Butyrivibrio fibrisolvens DSM 3071]|uniref:Uncharacterized protein n=1 Tax=Butyrivibrio fibrisolvens DSM 3071 TaxID=1121131 RepID=A0A1M5ZQ10_BUTFI|nr:hypothetical protein [Butyrivibrio fibrisolvens]SHI26310.1 hypothetical protein SAMN02745229_02554 [Butyrivibrio fibrisolvens DSM 3071]
MANRVGIDPEIAQEGITNLQAVMDLLQEAKDAYLPYRDNCNEVFGDELGAQVHEVGEKLLTGMDQVNESTESYIKWGKDLVDSYISVKDSCKALFERFL